MIVTGPFLTTDEHRASILERIEKLRNYTKSDEDIPEVESQIEALRLIEITENGDKIPLPETKTEIVNRSNWPPVHKQGNIIVSGADVQSLFPSLLNLEVSRLVKWVIAESKVELKNINHKLALRYIYIIGGAKIFEINKLRKYMSKWLGSRSYKIRWREVKY